MSTKSTWFKVSISIFLIRIIYFESIFCPETQKYFLLNFKIIHRNTKLTELEARNSEKEFIIT
jgi:hypothetical protein